MSEIKVVNSKKKELEKMFGYKNGLEEFLEASKDHIYIGRDMTYYVPAAVGSKWKNPFKLAKYDNDIDKVLQLYKDHVRNGPLYDDLHELKGKTLACWCYPSPCHGDVLKKMYDDRYEI